MNTDTRREALEKLDEAWRRAADSDYRPAERNVEKALDLLESTIQRGDEPVIVATMVHRHVEEGRTAILYGDLLGAMLAAIAALNALRPGMQSEAENFEPDIRPRSMRSCAV